MNGEKGQDTHSKPIPMNAAPAVPSALGEPSARVSAASASAVIRRRQRKQVSPGFRLTERDYQLFSFLLDQKFASLEALFFRFFDPRSNHQDPLPEQFRVARQRLGILMRAGLLVSQRVYSESKSLYLLSPKGFQCLQARHPSSAYTHPVREVDFRNFDHDTRVNLCRIALERSGKAIAWYPERRIRMHGFQIVGVREGLPESIIPDGIFESSKGERIALEVEASVRKKSRFRSKIETFANVFSADPPLMHRVLFVACSDAVGKDLAEVVAEVAKTRWRKPEFASRFMLESYAHFKASLYGQDPNAVVQVQPFGGALAPPERKVRARRRPAETLGAEEGDGEDGSS